MRVLIIGCGYVGLPLATELVRQGHDVYGLRRSRSTAPELKAAGINPLFGDITKPEELETLPREFDWVANCVSSSGGSAEEYRHIYLKGTQNLIRWLKLRNGGTARFVYTSSTSVYGQTEGSTVDENSPAEPTAESARVLVETENLLLDASRLGNFPAIILRVAGIYGPGRGYWFKQFQESGVHLGGEKSSESERSNVANQPAQSSSIAETTSPSPIGWERAGVRANVQRAGSRILNMIHRDDVIGCIIAALKRGRPGEIYNAVDNEPVSQFDLFSWLATRTGKPMPEAESADTIRKRGNTSKRVSNAKLKKELGYQFQFPTFREGYAARE